MYAPQADLYKYAGLTADDACLTPASWNAAMYRAEKIIDRYTFNRIRSMASVPEAVKRLECDLTAVELSVAESVNGEKLKSFNNDGYSESYEVMSAEDARKLEEQMVIDYLSGEKDDSGTPLLYLGVD